MKAIVEFGVRGGAHTSHTCATIKEASNLAASLAFVFGMQSARESFWKVKRNMPRISGTSSTHFIAVSILDGEMRGPWYTNTRYAADRNERKE